MSGIGPTGEFPQGSLRDDDAGELRIRVGALDGKVFVQFGVPSEWIAGGPEWARGLAALLVKRADEIEMSISAGGEEKCSECGGTGWSHDPFHENGDPGDGMEPCPRGCKVPTQVKECEER